MTKDEALKLALEYVELVPDDRYNAEHIDREALVTAIREALAQPEHGWTPERIAGMARLKDAQDKKLAQPEQEPVGQLLENAFGRGQVMWFNKPKDESMLYTTPPQRTWVGLTEEEIDQGLLRSDYAFKTAEAWRAGVVFAMTKLKEKNCA